MMKPEISKKILGKNYKKRKKQQSTESQRSIKYRNISNDGPVFRFSLPGGGFAPLALVSYANGFER